MVWIQHNTELVSGSVWWAWGKLVQDPTGDATGTASFRTGLDLDLSLLMPVTG